MSSDLVTVSFIFINTFGASNYFAYDGQYEMLQINKINCNYSERLLHLRGIKI